MQVYEKKYKKIAINRVTKYQVHEPMPWTEKINIVKARSV